MRASYTAPETGQASSPVDPLAATDSSNTREGLRYLGRFFVDAYAPPVQTEETRNPITTHQINVPVLLTMFRTMYMQLMDPIVSDTDQPIPSISRTSAELESMAASLAYDAAVAAASVCYDKARRLDPMIYLSGYIAAVIGSLGPVECNSITSRWVHVPVIDLAHVESEFPSGYKASYHHKFREQHGSKMVFSNFKTRWHTLSSPWWTLWPVEGLCHRSNGPGDRDVSDAGDNGRKWTVFSPVKPEETADYLKPAILFAGEPLSKPGIGPSSVINWYEREALRNFVSTTPSPLDFPSDTRQPAYFWKNAPAFHASVETRWVPPELGTNDDAAPSITGQQRNHSQMNPDNQAKRRKVAPTHEKNSNHKQDGRIFEYRVVYHYFDHVVLEDTEPSDFKFFLSEACETG